MKRILIINLIIFLTTYLSYSSDEPPILKPKLDAEESTDYNGKRTITNEGSLGGEFSTEEGLGSVTIIKSDLNGKNALKFEAQSNRKKGSENLPCIYFKNIPESFPNGLTAEFRIKPEPTSFPNKIYEIFSARASDRGPGLGIFYQAAYGDHINVVSGDGGVDALIWGIRKYDTQENPVVYGQWLHVTVVYDIEKLQFLLYLNGKLTKESETGLELTPLDPIATIGAYRKGYAYPFFGEMTDIAIYDYVRTPEQIQDAAALQ